MILKKKRIDCCKGEYHIIVDGKFYCMKPPDVECTQVCRDVGKFTKGEKKILYCQHHQHPCEKCQMLIQEKYAEGD